MLGLRKTISGLIGLGQERKPEPPYAYRPGDTVVEEFAEFAGMDIPSVVEGIRHYKELNKATWARLQGQSGNWTETARQFYASADHYVFDHLSANPTPTAVLEKLDRFDPGLLLAVRKSQGKDFLEFGGGTGVFCEAMAREGFKVTYLDIPGRVRDFAAWRFAKHGVEIEMITSNPDRLTLEKSYDVIFTDAVFEHLIHPEQVLEELLAHLKPGGTFVFIVDLSGPTENDPEHRHVDIDHLHGIIERSGCECSLGRGKFASVWLRPAAA
jgi:2-polyprenyl-3-methyl-5-hydroxy-6-metoxy-1,4-benzoquinol methylase